MAGDDSCLCSPFGIKIFLSQAEGICPAKLMFFHHLFSLICPMAYKGTEAYALGNSRICRQQRTQAEGTNTSATFLPLPLGRRWGGWRVSRWDIDGIRHWEGQRRGQFVGC